MTRKQTIDPDPEDLRKDLLAALAAGRELGPEMDSAIVDAHLRRHYGPQAIEPAKPRPRPSPPAVVQRTPVPWGAVMPLAMAMLGITAFVALAVATGGHMLWFLVPLMFWGWGGGYRRWSRRYRGGSWNSGPYDPRYQHVAPGARREIPPEII